jgi:hypothetical protein
MTRHWVRVLAVGGGMLLGVGMLPGSAASLSLTSQNFTPYRTCTITATPATTTAVADTTAAQGSPTTPSGASTTVTVSSGNGTNQRIYVKFDLTVCSPAIPASAIVRVANLRLYMTAVPATVCRALDLFPVTVAWGETTLTWNNQPFGTTINNPPTASRTGTFSVGTAGGCQNQAAGYVTGGTVTSDVASFVAGSVTNFGWMIRDDTEGASPPKTATFSAKELATIAQEPQLVITYVRVP